MKMAWDKIEDSGPLTEGNPSGCDAKTLPDIGIVVLFYIM